GRREPEIGRPVDRHLHVVRSRGHCALLRPHLRVLRRSESLSRRGRPDLPRHTGDDARARGISCNQPGTSPDTLRRTPTGYRPHRPSQTVAPRRLVAGGCRPRSPPSAARCYPGPPMSGHGGGDRSAEDEDASGRRPALAVTAAGLFLAAFAYLYAFRNEGLFHLDAVFLAQTVEQIYAGGPWDMHWRFGVVLANALVYLPFWLQGENAERSTILASILFHAASIPMVFLFLERLCGSRLLAALSAGLLAVAPVYSVANTFGKEYGLAVLLVATSFYLALRARDVGGAVCAAASAWCFALSYIVWEGL